MIKTEKRSENFIIKKSKKNPVNSWLFFSRTPTMLRGGERLVYQGPNKLNLLRIKDIYSFSPHPLYSEVDRMMVMYVKCMGVTHFLTSLASLNLLSKSQ